MARKVEFIRKSEARILIYLQNAADYMKVGKRMSIKLNMDYVYLMKMLGQMYNKGWVSIYEYNRITHFNLTKKAPMSEAIKKNIK